MGQNPRVKANKIAPVCPDPGNVLTHAGALGHASNGCSGEHCVWNSEELRLAPYYVDAVDTDAKATKAGGGLLRVGMLQKTGFRPHRRSFSTFYTLDSGHVPSPLQLKSKQQSLGQGNAALLAGRELSPKGGAFTEACVQGLASSMFKAFWKEREPNRAEQRMFPICQQESIGEQRHFLQSCGFRCRGLTSFFLSACLSLRRLPPMLRVFVERAGPPADLVASERQLLRF